MGYAPDVAGLKVRDVMTPIRVSSEADATLRAAASAMADAGVGALVVLGPTASILTERDLLGPIASGLDLDSEVVGDHVRGGRPSVDPEEDLGAVAERMSAQDVRHALVTTETEAIGMVSMRDIVGALGRTADR